MDNRIVDLTKIDKKLKVFIGDLRLFYKRIDGYQDEEYRLSLARHNGGDILVLQDATQGRIIRPKEFGNKWENEIRALHFGRFPYLDRFAYDVGGTPNTYKKLCLKAKGVEVEIEGKRADPETGSRVFAESGIIDFKTVLAAAEDVRNPMIEEHVIERERFMQNKKSSRVRIVRENWIKVFDELNQGK